MTQLELEAAREYEPLDLAEHFNAAPSSVELDSLPSGEASYHGLPFRFGAGDRSLIALGQGLSLKPVEILLARRARYVIFAHRLIDSKLEQGEPVGRECAQYRFVFDDGESVSVPVRERLEIGKIPFAWGQVAILAYPDEKDGLMPRDAGDWQSTGYRQCEVTQAWPRSFYVWAWRNPRPDSALTKLVIEAEGPRFVVLGVTLGHLDEYPFNRNARLDAKLTLLDEKDALRPFDLRVEVDRGTATYPYPLPTQAAEEFLDDDFRGFGQSQSERSSPAHVEIAANPSATVIVKHHGEAIGRAKWSQVLERRSVDASPRLRIELCDTGRNWVHTRVLDAQTNKPVPCRIHFRSQDGIPYQPHGHHHYVNSNLGSWHIDVGGDLRLGQMTYAYIDGTCQGWLPRGSVFVDVARGFEYEPLRAKVEILPGQRELVLELRRMTNMNARRYFSGDTHVHFLSTQGAQFEAAGEDLNVVNLLQSQWGHLFTDTQEFTGRPSTSADGRHIVYASQENRQHILGHLILLGLKQPVMPWCSDGPSEAELGGNLETTVARWADACHAQGGTVVLPHMPNPNCEPAVLIATGRVDAVEMCEHMPYIIGEYYKYLNCGYRLPLTGGTDKMSSDVPVGLYRTYVHIPADEPFDYDSWCKNLRRGNTFISAGPLLTLSVEGRPIGDTLELAGNGGSVQVEALAESVLPMYCLEIVQNGRVVARVEESRPVRRLELKERLHVDRHSWIAARAAGPGFSRVSHHDAWHRGVLAHTSPVYVSVGGPWWMFDPDVANYLLTLAHGGLDYVRQRSPQWRPETVTHHHGAADHMAYLEEPFLQAIEALHRRFHELGIQH